MDLTQIIVDLKAERDRLCGSGRLGLRGYFSSVMPCRAT